jgi:iron complex transport system ATP-binding protein
LLILDEPCAGLDPVARSRLLALLATLATAKRSPAIIMVTHHVEEIIPAVTHMLLLKKGRVLAAGSKSSVLNSTNLSTAFDCPVRLIKNRGGYRLELLGPVPAP